MYICLILFTWHMYLSTVPYSIVSDSCPIGVSLLMRYCTIRVRPHFSIAGAIWAEFGAGPLQ